MEVTQVLGWIAVAHTVIAFLILLIDRSISAEVRRDGMKIMALFMIAAILAFK